jgi:serine protease AprX
MRFYITIIVFLFTGLYSFSQTEYQIAPNKYWVEFTDKNNSPYSVERPQEFLSDKSIERRNRQGIIIEESDLPVNPSYINALQELNLHVHTISKWLNGAVIETDDIALLDTIENLPFIAKLAKPPDNADAKNNLRTNKFLNTFKNQNDDYYDYGLIASRQINMHRGKELHNSGYRGENILIAILDAGFNGLYSDSNITFDSIIQNEQIKFIRDFVTNSDNINTSNSHGMSVLSVICANVPGTITGTAPKADFALIRTEDASTEYIVEELYWAAGAEYADSIGADIINVSLGYTDYDIPQWSHNNEVFDGNTTWISRAANIAAEKGILLVVAAGNNGNSTPPNLGAPADSYNVLSIGALRADSVYANFSSRGPTADGRYKPDIMSVGQGTFLQQNGYVGFGSGTSFSSPVISGLSACLWQANPNATNFEILDAIKASANLFLNPNDSMGYGIPDFYTANNILKDLEVQKNQEEIDVMVFPNPFTNQFILRFTKVLSNDLKISIFNQLGQILYFETFNFNNYPERIIRISDFTPSKNGLYILKIETDTEIFTKKIMKAK